jgi:phosphoglycerate kinase
MSYTFLKAKGYDIGRSILDNDSLEYAQKIINEYSDKLVLPIDVNVTEEFNNTTINRIVNVENIDPKEMGMDIGPGTIENFKNILSTAKTVFWNGPLGVYEFSKYNIGTKKILEYVTTINAHVVLGGGDIVAAASMFDCKDKVTHACTGGGATLEYLEGKSLPGIEVIADNN